MSDFYTKYANYSDEKIIEILNKKADYQPKAVEAAVQIAEERKLEIPETEEEKEAAREQERVKQMSEYFERIVIQLNDLGYLFDKIEDKTPEKKLFVSRRGIKIKITVGDRAEYKIKQPVYYQIFAILILSPVFSFIRFLSADLGIAFMFTSTFVLFLIAYGLASFFFNLINKEKIKQIKIEVESIFYICVNTNK